MEDTKIFKILLKKFCWFQPMIKNWEHRAVILNRELKKVENHWHRALPEQAPTPEAPAPSLPPQRTKVNLVTFISKSWHILKYVDQCFSTAGAGPITGIWITLYQEL
jgi:hypothetical protein